MIIKKWLLHIYVKGWGKRFVCNYKIGIRKGGGGGCLTKHSNKCQEIALSINKKVCVKKEKVQEKERVI